jgi:hypothetical protein
MTHAAPRFFHHAGPPSPVPLTNETRYLCAAAYLDHDFPARVAEEVIEDEHRAVAVSTDADLNVVIRHCLHARGERLKFDLFLTLMLVVGVILTPTITLAWILAAVAWRLRRRPNAHRVALVLGGLSLLVLCCGLSLSLYSVAESLFTMGTSYEQNVTGTFYEQDPSGALDIVSPWLSLYTTLLVPIALAVGSWLVLFGYRLRVLSILSRDLAPNGTMASPPVADSRVARRLLHVSGAQWGNLTLYDTNPFVGAGRVRDAWSIATELRPAAKPGGESSSPNALIHRHIAIDPLALHQHIWNRIAELSSPTLPDYERVPGLRMLHHVVAPGDRRRQDPLIDVAQRLPYAMATPEAIAALVRHPQGSPRYYQRALVQMVGKPVMSPAGEVVAPAQANDVAVSVFTYVAVEGAMLYIESVMTVLPPVAPQFHAVDAMAPSLRVRRALIDALRELPWGTVGAPGRAVRSLMRTANMTRNMEVHRTEAREQVVYAHGARASVREMAALAEPHTYLQRLDVEKYGKLIARRSTEAILEFLRAQGVDTSEYEKRIELVHNQGVIISGGTVTGAVAAGTGATATATEKQ